MMNTGEGARAAMGKPQSRGGEWMLPMKKLPLSDSSSGQPEPLGQVCSQRGNVRPRERPRL